MYRPHEKKTTRTHEGKLLCQYCPISLQEQDKFGDIQQKVYSVILLKLFPLFVVVFPCLLTI